jgi:opacity protein-like surface antigen
MNMKYSVLAAAAAGIVMGSTVHASDMDVRPYVGAELSYNMPKYNNNATYTINGVTGQTGVDIKKSKPGLGAFIGARICEYFGVEAGYNQVMKAKKDDYSGRINNMYLDGMGYFAASPEIDLIAALGIGRLKQKVSSFDVDNNGTKAKTSYRVGAGVQYKFDENVAGRLMFRHQKGNKDYFKSMDSIALGVTYIF